MKPFAVLAVGLLASVLLAGCTGGEDDSGALATLGGVVEGRVLDDSLMPVVGASVRVLLTDFETQTDQFGGFVFTDVPAGPVRVVASKEGHASGTRSATLLDGGSLSFQFILASAPKVVGFVDVKRFDGRIACGVPPGADCSAVPAEAGANATHHYAVGAGLVAVVVEMQWTPTAGGLSDRLAFDVHSASSRGCAAKYAGVVGSSVLRLDVPEGFPISGGHECVVAKAAPDAATAQQEYSVFLSLFYHDAPEPGYSALGAE